MLSLPVLLNLVFLAQDGGVPASETSVVPVMQRVADFSQLVNTFQKYYAMENYKLLKRNVDLRDNAKWLALVNDAALSDNAFAETLVKWTAQFDDGHVTLTFPFTWNATLGFNVDLYADEKVRVTAINADRLPPSKYPLQLGWELIELDGKSVSEWIDTFTPFSASGSRASTKRLAARQLTQRFQDIMPGAPQAIGTTATVTFLDFGGNPQTYEIDWRVAGDAGRTFLPASKRPTATESAADLQQPGPQAALPASRASLVNSPRTPFFAQPGWKELAPGNTYYATKLSDPETKLTYGLIRIPSFSPKSTDQAIGDLESLLKQMQTGPESVKGIIIDLTENPGGSVWFCQQMLQRLAAFERNTLDFRTAGFRIRPSTAWLDAFDSYLADKTWSADAKIQLLEQRQRIETRLITDPRLLTDPIPLNLEAAENLKTITKWPFLKIPLLVLVDELTASAAELFASVVQDDQLGAIAGAPTMGAGGTVAVRQGTVVTEAKVSFAESMMESPSGRELENDGVLPDVPLTFRTEANARTANAPFLNGLLAAMRARRQALGLN